MTTAIAIKPDHDRGHLGYASVVSADMRQLVGDRTLEFFAIKLIDQAARDADHGMFGIAAGREGVRSRVLHQAHARHGHMGRERHLLDHVQHRLLFH